MKEQIDDARQKAILNVNHWGGRTLTYGGTLIMEDKSVYTYRYCLFMDEESGNDQQHSFLNNKNHLTKIKELSDGEFKKVISFIEEILKENYTNQQIFDYGYSVKVNYNGVKKEVKNVDSLYNKAEDLIASLTENNS